MSAYGPDATPSAPIEPAPIANAPIEPAPTAPAAPAASAATAPAAAPAASPAAPAEPVLGRVWLPRSPGQAAFRGAVAVLLIVTGILGQVAGSGFPSNAPVEMFINFGITAVLVAAGIVLGVFAVLAGTVRSVAVAPGRFSALVIAGAVLVLSGVLTWAATVPSTLIAWSTQADRMRFDELAGPPFLTGALWTTGVVLAAVGFRSTNIVSRIAAATAVVLGLGLGAWVVYAAALYSAGVTD